ncbi:MAG: transposase [Bacteroidota bacterium]
METTLFGAESGRSLEWQLFLAHPLGKLYQTIPFQAITQLLPIRKNNCGVKGRFTRAGGLGLQILKHYYKQSDKKLIEQLNSNWAMQLFCGIRLKKGEQIKDEEVVGRWRAYFGLHLDLDLAQYSLAQVWQGQM